MLLDVYKRQSNTSLGAVLSQLANGEKRVITYYSKTLSKPERNYCVTMRELLAIELWSTSINTSMGESFHYVPTMLHLHGS